MNPKIQLIWDPDARVWVAQSDDIPGLVLEAPTRAALAKKLWYAIPELQGLNLTAQSREADQQNVAANADGGEGSPSPPTHAEL